MRVSSAFTMLAIAASGWAGGPALAECTTGETQCGADSLVAQCTAEHTWRTDPNTVCNRNLPQPRRDDGRTDGRGRDAATSGKCTTGISRCGAGGQVERCTDSNAWAVDPGSFCSR